MKWFNSLRLGQKLGLAFSAVLALTVLVGVLSVWELAQVNNTSKRFSARWMPSIRVIEDIKSQIARIRTRELQYIISSNLADMDKYDQVIAKDLVDLKKMQDEFVVLASSPEERAMYAKFVDMWARYMEEDGKIRAAARANNDDQARALIRGESNKLIVALRGQVDQLVDYYTDGGKLEAVEGDRRYNSSRLWILGLVIGSVAFGATGGLMITRWITRSLGGEPDYATDIVSQIAAGDLGVTVETRAGDTTSLLYGMRTMRDNLEKIVGEVRGATGVITHASGEIAAGNLDLSSRTEQQASSLEETAASMEELTSTVRHNADNSAQANQLASSAASVAQKGNAVVAQVVETMGAINTSSRKIADIIAVIDGIAFQTNILALNAAVEAARAGEQGRGFAVVATEVRNLAQRSAASAKEIKDLIGESVGQVENGSKLVAEAGATMNEVLESVQSMAGVMAEISHASREQSAGIEQVNQAISQMDTVTQQNAELVQQAASAAQGLQDQAATLSQLVSVFRLKDGGRGAAPAVRPVRGKSWPALSGAVR
ncbi:methyl-accepting chemotaxis protein [Rugamonas sp. FT107W]|uniref:Methyl-accepting chemotaxis protein n=1 Tax=Duganella vulcania TaxID=2692166 RepID=A0A845HV41_9BURK|nr:methyl-accepting chemotaxis protein [Duganella vulcania]MYN20236.1 methyl-accepting chemotaxis protein [Duganella vulcania]